MPNEFKAKANSMVCVRLLRNSWLSIIRVERQESNELPAIRRARTFRYATSAVGRCLPDESFIATVPSWLGARYSLVSIGEKLWSTQEILRTESTSRVGLTRFVAAFGLTVQAILGALFAFPLETEFKRVILVVFPSIQPTSLATSRTALGRRPPCESALPCRYRDSHAREARYA